MFSTIGTSSITAAIKSGTSLLLCGVLALHVCTVGQQCIAFAANNGPQHPSSITDIGSITHNGVTTVYAVDSETGQLYRHVVMGTSPERLGLDNFDPFPAVQSFKKPKTLTTIGEKLLIFDEGSQAIFEVDTVSSEVTKLVDQAGIADPVSITVSDKGVIAVGDDAEDCIVTFEPTLGAEGRVGFTRRLLDLRLDDPDRLIYIGPDLFVLDTEEGKVSLVEGSPSEPRTQSITSLNALLADIKNEVPRVQDIVHYNGVFYVAGEGRVIAFTPFSSHKSFPVFKEGEKRLRGTSLPKIAASDGYLFVKETSRRGVLRVPRPVPVTVNFEPSASSQPLEKTFEQQRGSLIYLYEYLAERDILPTQTFTTPRNYQSLKELLFEQGVLIDPNEGDAPTEGKVASDKRLSKLLCKYNPSLCQPADPLLRPIPAGQTVVLPNIPKESELTLVKLSLGQKTVQEVLSKILTPRLLPTITAEYLLSINSDYAQTLEAELTQDNFITTNWTGLDLKPGTLITFENNRERVVGNLGTCDGNFDSRIKRENMPAPASLRSRTVDNFLPRRLGQSLTPGLASDLNISEVLIDAKGWVKESSELRDLGAMMQSSGSDPRCGLPANAAGKIYLVDQAIKASGVQYKFLSNNGTHRTLTEKNIEQANLLGQPYQGKDFSLTVDEPLYFAYTLLLAEADKPVEQWKRVRTREIKAGTRQDIFSASGRVFFLPATRWRLSMFVDGADIYDDQSGLNRTLEVPGLSILKEERPKSLTRKPSSAALALLGLAPQTQKELLSKNRQALLDKIGRYPPLARLSQVRVGIAEAKSSVHVNHPDMAGSWYQKSGANELAPITVPASAPVPADDMFKDFSDNDHGDHVAGLIAAGGDAAPGLAPGVQLFLIDTTNQESEASLEKDINDAIVRNIRIFNLSFTIGGNNAPQVSVPLDNLAERMRTSPVWSEALFVAAAGNEGKHLANLSDRIPVKWVTDVPNIIGVAAMDDSNNVLGQWECKPDRQPPLNMCSGSNYGHKWVQLAAPGFNLYSTASGGRYAQATGSSQAVPLVTAAAAMLRAQRITHPSLIKGRLIYTATWLSQFDAEKSAERKVWGGMLNFRRAVMYPTENLITLKSTPAVVSRFNFVGGDKLTIDKADGRCHIDDANNVDIDCPGEVDFENVLRITFQPENTLFRVIYLSGTGTKTLRIMRDAKLSGRVRCESLQDMDPTTFVFADPRPCTQPVDVTRIGDYIAAVPSAPIRF